MPDEEKRDQKLDQPDEPASKPLTTTTESKLAVDQRVHRWAEIATAINGPIAVVALLVSVAVGLWTYLDAKERKEQQTELSAVQLYRSYLELLVSHPESFQMKEEAKPEVVGSVVLATAEALYHLTENDPGWKKTVVYILRRHENVVRTGGPWDCKTLSDRFMNFVQNEIGFDLPCVDDRK